MNAARNWFGSLPARYGRRTLIALVLIAVLGLGCRAVAVVHPVSEPADDSHAYYALAKSLYTEGSYGGPDFHSEATSDWSPGAPWLYAGLFVVTGGPREGTIRILEALMGVATILVVFLLGWRLGGRWPALLGALGVAIYPPFIHSVGEIMSEPPAMLSLPAAILAFFWAWDRTWGRSGDGPWSPRRAAPAAPPGPGSCPASSSAAPRCSGPSTRWSPPPSSSSPPPAGPGGASGPSARPRSP